MERNDEEKEVRSPLKTPSTEPREYSGGGTNHRLDMDLDVGERHQACKQKSKATAQLLDLSVPAGGSHALVLVGLVHSRVNQLGGWIGEQWRQHG